MLNESLIIPNFTKQMGYECLFQSANSALSFYFELFVGLYLLFLIANLLSKYFFKKEIFDYGIVVFTISLAAYFQYTGLITEMIMPIIFMLIAYKIIQKILSVSGDEPSSNADKQGNHNNKYCY